MTKISPMRTGRPLSSTPDKIRVPVTFPRWPMLRSVSRNLGWEANRHRNLTTLRMSRWSRFSPRPNRTQLFRNQQVLECTSRRFQIQIHSKLHHQRNRLPKPRRWKSQSSPWLTSMGSGLSRWTIKIVMKMNTKTKVPRNTMIVLFYKIWWCRIQIRQKTRKCRSIQPRFP